MTTATSDEPRYPNITVKLTGTDGNAWSIIGRVQAALRRRKVPEQTVKEFVMEATSGDYDNVLVTCMRWVDVE